MQLPAQLQELLLERAHLDPKLARQAKNCEIVFSLYRCLQAPSTPTVSRNKKVAGQCVCQPPVHASRANRLRGKRTAAAATARRIRVLKYESLPHQRLFVVQ